MYLTLPYLFYLSIFSTFPIFSSQLHSLSHHHQLVGKDEKLKVEEEYPPKHAKIELAHLAQIERVGVVGVEADDKVTQLKAKHGHRTSACFQLLFSCFRGEKVEVYQHPLRHLLVLGGQLGGEERQAEEEERLNGAEDVDDQAVKQLQAAKGEQHGEESI